MVSGGGLPFGEVFLDGGGCDAADEPADELGGCEKLGLMDSLPVGVRLALRVDEPLRDEQAQHHRDRVLWGAGAREGGHCFRVVLALRLRPARVRVVTFPCLVVVGWSTHSRYAQAAARP
ncbi:MAG: hypothetical protein WKF65_00460 [Gaiellaceae bacterium]